MVCLMKVCISSSLGQGVSMDVEKEELRRNENRIEG